MNEMFILFSKIVLRMRTYLDDNDVSTLIPPGVHCYFSNANIRHGKLPIVLQLTTSN